MAAGILSKPGTELGPCATACQHVDCASARRDAESRCVYCGEPIGYETRFYARDGGMTGKGWAHALCVEQEVERDQQ
jgi:hypothetical protein